MANTPNNPQNTLLVFKQMRLEDIGKDPLAGLQNFAGIYNQFGLSVYNLLSGNLQFDQNIDSQISSVTFATPSNYSDGANTNFTSTAISVPFNPNGIVLLGIQQINSNAVFIKPVFPSWFYNANSQVVINYVTGLQPSTNYSITILII